MNFFSRVRLLAAAELLLLVLALENPDVEKRNVAIKPSGEVVVGIAKHIRRETNHEEYLEAGSEEIRWTSSEDFALNQVRLKPEKAPKQGFDSTNQQPATCTLSSACTGPNACSNGVCCSGLAMGCVWNSNTACCGPNLTCTSVGCCTPARACNSATICCPGGTSCASGSTCCPDNSQYKTYLDSNLRSTTGCLCNAAEQGLIPVGMVPIPVIMKNPLVTGQPGVSWQQCCIEAKLACGQICCNAGQTCANSATNKCCNDGVALCGSNCCNAGEVCVGSPPSCCAAGKACGSSCC